LLLASLIRAFNAVRGGLARIFFELYGPVSTLEVDTIGNIRYISNLP